MRHGYMRPLITGAAIACLAQTAGPAGAWTMTDVVRGGGDSAQTLPQAHGMDPMLRVVFAERVAVSGASAVIRLDQATVFIDPVGPQSQYSRFGRPDIVVLTRAHPDHLSIDTMIGMLRRDTVVLAPQSVIDRLPLMIANNVITPFEAGMSQVVDGISFRALPATSDIPTGAQVYRRDRGGLGVVIDVDGVRAYF